jgi:hypothetical protein
MRMRERLLIVLLSVFCLAEGGVAMAAAAPNILHLPAGGAPPPATIEDVAWIAGAWHGEALGGLAEEIWSAPRAGTMMGMFRLIEGGQLRFYELLAIREEGESLALRLKHFNADLTGWEEKGDPITFPLVKLGDREAYFDGVTFRREGERLTVFVLAGAGQQTAGELIFEYRQ